MREASSSSSSRLGLGSDAAVVMTVTPQELSDGLPAVTGIHSPPERNNALHWSLQTIAKSIYRCKSLRRELPR